MELMKNVNLNLGASVKGAILLGLVLVLIYSTVAVRICGGNGYKAHGRPKRNLRPYFPKVLRMGRNYSAKKKKTRTILFTASSTDAALAIILALVFNNAVISEHYYGVTQVFMNLSGGAVLTSHIFAGLAISLLSVGYDAVLYGAMQVVQYLRAVQLTAELRSYGFFAHYAQRRSLGFFFKYITSEEEPIKEEPEYIDARRRRQIMSEQNYLAKKRRIS